MATELVTFDYGALDSLTRAFVTEATERIRQHARRSVAEIVQLGQELNGVKDRLSHGQFGAWLLVEFSMDERSAQRYMRIAREFKSDTVSDLEFSLQALYTLSAPSAPESARQEAIERANTGERITQGKAKRIVASHKPSIAKAPRAQVNHPEIPDSSPEPTGKSTVNGHAADDPEDIARLRAVGVIPANAVVEIDEPDPNEIEPFEAPPEPSEDDLTDEEWLAGLPLSGMLDGVPLRTFCRDALLYRRLQKARASYKHAFTRERGALDRERAHARVRGPYEGKSSWWLKAEHPRHWHVCPPGDKGGCTGTGQIPPISKCPLCNGSGYLVH